MKAIPTETIITVLVFETDPEVTNSTSPASICRSGSAIEITNPRIIPASSTMLILLVFAILEPSKLPMGVIPSSMPNRKMDNPETMKIAPIRNLMRTGGAKGVSVKFNKITMTVIGKTEKKPL